MKVIREMEDLSDDSLVKEAKEGDPEAFTELVCRYQRKIYNIVIQFTRNHLDADDLTQEIFMNTFKSLRGLNRSQTSTPGFIGLLSMCR